MENGELYIVATPIGNLEDITYRAVKVLSSVDYIACEDTRVTKRLLDKYNISANLFDYHKFNEKQRCEKVITLLKSGKSVALVSDAGTPGISDPGGVLINELNKNSIKINSIPGPSAISTFLASVPRETEIFTFIGFVPRTKSGQEKLFSRFKTQNAVFYESANRLIATLNNIQEFFGEDTMVCVGRELTKIYEEIKIDSVAKIIKYYETNPLKGEIVAMIYAKEESYIEDSEILQRVKTLKSEGFSDKDISKIISSLFSVNKNKVYKLSLQIN